MYWWEGVNEFVAVAETESFTRATSRLRVSTAQVRR
jgi:DNA-binding transcriptional LysR family regulator